MDNEQKFTTFLEQVQKKQIIRESIKQMSKKYQINTSQLLKLTPSQIVRLRRIILNKKNIEKQFKEKMQLQWNECEKKIFNWICLCYAHQHGMNLQNLSDEDFLFLSQITTQKSIPLIKYQVCTLLPQPNRPKWSEMQDKILHELLAVQCKFKTLGEWIYVSRQLFLRGDLRSYKTAKMCRQRWYNHVDPALIKEWTREDDLMMLESVNRDGKRWALISNQFNHSKNEHMIKNRFYSLLKKAQKSQKAKEMQEEELVIMLLKELKKQLSNQPEVKEQKKYVPIIVQQIKQQLFHQGKQQKNLFEMKLVTSGILSHKDSQLENCNNLNFIKNIKQLDPNKLFQEQALQPENTNQILKLSQSFNYSVTYPSPIPVTPGTDFNMFSDSNLATTYKGNFKFNLDDFLTRNGQ